MEATQDDRLGRAVDEILELVRSGQRPDLAALAERYPELANELPDLLDAILALEAAVPGSEKLANLPRSLNLAASSHPKPPRRLGGYMLLREVGRGGMGIVYEALQLGLGRRVALKVLYPWLSSDEQFVRRFQHEARWAANLHHTHIIPVYEVGEDKGWYYYSMRFIDGISLQQLVRKLTKGEAPAAPVRLTDLIRQMLSEVPATLEGGGLGHPSLGSIWKTTFASPEQRRQTSGIIAHTVLEPPDTTPSFNPESTGFENHVSARVGPRVAVESPQVKQPQKTPLEFREIARVGLQITSALQFAHQHGLLHRDVKPGNILIDRDGHVWLIDFGLARREGTELTEAGQLLGTLRYLPPERLEGHCDVRSDLYGVGLVLYELLTLQPAIQGVERDELLYRLKEAKIPAARKLNPKIPRDLETIVLKALAHDPNERYPTAADLREDLDRFLSDRPIRARRPSWLERWDRWTARNPELATVVTLMGLLLVFSLSMLLVACHLQRLVRALQESQAESQERLWQASLAQAAALTRSSEPGRCQEALEALAIALRSAPKRHGSASAPHRLFRDLAIRAFSLPDAVEEHLVRMSADVPKRLAAVAYHAASEQLAYGFMNEMVVFIRSLRSGGPTQRLPPGPGVPWAALFDPTGRYLAVYYDHWGRRSTFVWDLAESPPTGPKVALSETTSALAWNPAGTRLFVGQTGRVADVKVPENTISYIAAHGPVHTLQVDKGSNFLAITSGLSCRHALVYHLKEGKKLLELPHASGVYGLDWSTDGRQLAVGGADGKIYLWSLCPAPTLTETLQGHEAPVVRLRFLERDRALASSSWDRRSMVWRISDRSAVLRWPGSQVPTELGSGDQMLLRDWSQDRLTLIRWSPSQVYQPLSGRVLSLIKRGVASIYWINGGLVLTTGTDGFRLASISRGETRWAASLTDGHPIATGQYVGSDFDPVGQRLLTVAGPVVHEWPCRPDRSSTDGRVKLVVGPPRTLLGPLYHDLEHPPVAGGGGRFAVSLADGVWLFPGPDQQPDEPLKLPIHSPVQALSPDGRWLLTGGWLQHGVEVWEVKDLQSPQKHKHLYPDWLTVRTAFSPDGQWVALAHETTIRLLRVDGWTEVASVQRTAGTASSLQDANLVSVVSVAFSPRSDYVAVGGMLDRVDIFTIPQLQRLASLEHPGIGAVSALAWSPDGRWLAVGSLDGAIGFWDLHALQRELRRFDMHWSDEPSGQWQGEHIELVVQGREMYARQIDEARIRTAEAALRKAPGNPDALNQLAWLLLVSEPSLRDPARACRLAQEAAAGRPTHHATLKTLGIAYYRTGQRREAVETLRRCIDLHGAGGHPLDWFALAASYASSNNLDAAERCYWSGVERLRQFSFFSRAEYEEVSLIQREAAEHIFPNLLQVYRFRENPLVRADP